MNRDILEKEFEPSQIKRRRGPFGEDWDYVETADVIRRLNQAFDGEWSFEIVEYQQLFDEVLVLGKLTAQGIVKTQFGSHKITKSKKDGEVVNIGYDLKAAASDALKKASTHLGVALHLYSEKVVDTMADLLAGILSRSSIHRLLGRISQTAMEGEKGEHQARGEEVFSHLYRSRWCMGASSAGEEEAL